MRREAAPSPRAGAAAPARALDDLRLGDHAILLYRKRGELFDQLAGYFASGLRRGERCVLACQDEAFAMQARAAFAGAGLPVAASERRGALLFVAHDESYFVGGRFEPGAMVDFLRDSVAIARDDGFTGLRGAGEGSWVPHTPEDEAAWIGYERDVNQVFAEGGLAGLCFYSLERFAARTLVPALDAHPILIDGRVVRPAVSGRKLVLAELLPPPDLALAGRRPARPDGHRRADC